MTFDLDLWPTDLNINRGHLRIKDYLPTKFEASEAKHSWVISCTRWSKLAWPLTLTFDLLTWISIGVISASRTIYLPSLKLLGQSVLELSVCTRWSNLAWPFTLTFDLLTWRSIGVIYSSRTIYIPSLKLLRQSILELSVAQGELTWHDLWPWPLTYWPVFNRGHLLIKDYPPTKFEASGAKRSWVISCTRWSKLAWPLTLTFDLLTWKSIGIIYLPRTIYLPSLKLLGQIILELSVAQGYGIPTYRPTDIPTDIPTDRHTDIPTDRCKAICPSFFKGGINI